MYEQHLLQAGLSPEQAKIYEALLKTGHMTAGKISSQTGLKRGLTYKILAELATLNLLEKEEIPGKVARFTLKHPNKIKELAQKREQQAKDAQTALESVLPSIISYFNLLSGMQGVLYFEGKEGVMKVLEDSLTAKETIMTIGDVEAIALYADDINREYVKKRKARGIQKQGIVLDSKFSREFFKNYDRAVTETRFISHKLYPFKSIIQIYNNKISYMTLTAERLSGVIIEDANIYQMHRFIFEFLWKYGKTYSELPPLSENM